MERIFSRPIVGSFDGPSVELEAHLPKLAVASLVIKVTLYSYYHLKLYSNEFEIYFQKKFLCNLS